MLRHDEIKTGDLLRSKLKSLWRVVLLTADDVMIERLDTGKRFTISKNQFNRNGYRRHK